MFLLIFLGVVFVNNNLFASKGCKEKIWGYDDYAVVTANYLTARSKPYVGPYTTTRRYFMKGDVVQFIDCNNKGWLKTTDGYWVRRMNRKKNLVRFISHKEANREFIDYVKAPVKNHRGLTEREQALLDLIAFAEGTKRRYNIIYGYKRFYRFKDHPRRVNCDNYCSDAAGRYQFLSKTWDRIRRKLKLKSFRPRNQDRAALELIKERGVDPNNITSKWEFELALAKLSLEWASLPGSPYGQPTKNISILWRFYSSRI